MNEINQLRSTDKKAEARANGRLLRVVLPFVLVVALQTALAGGSLEVMSAVRSYVAGEALWSKGQKDAIHSITQYVTTGDETDFKKFEETIAIPFADRTARFALEGSHVDLAKAREGFLRGGNHSDDVAGMIWLFRYFRQVSYMARAVELWRETDAPLDRLVALAEEIHLRRAANGTDRELLDDWNSRIDAVDRQLAPMATAFSESLGEGSRAIKFMLSIAIIASAMLLIGLVLSHTRRMVTMQRQAEDALKTEKENAQLTLASIGDAVIVTDADGRASYVNPAARKLLDYDRTRINGELLSSLFRLMDDPGAPHSQAPGSGITANAPHSKILVRSDGSSVPVSIVDSRLGGKKGAGGSVIVLRDMTAERQLVSQLSWQAAHDGLTELPNRREFEYRLGRALQGLGEGGSISLMFLDLDQFKVVNDTCGHAAGDQLLRQTSATLNAIVAPDGTLARLGGDEFAILFQNISTEMVIFKAEQLRLAVQDSTFVWNSNAFKITVSIGFVHLNETHTLEEALRAADMACYLAKEKGRNRVEIHDPGDQDLAQRIGEMNWVQKIREGIENRRFCLYAQEIRSLTDAEPNHLRLELLLRLRGPDGEVFLPGAFMPPAERYGLTPLIDRWVVRTAFEEMARHNALELHQRVSYSINVSGIALGDVDFIEYVSGLFDKHQILPQSVCFEITETNAISNMAEAKRFIMAMRELGIRFSLDDFGTGMSSIAYLKHLPVDYLKIDGSFVREILNSKVDRSMVEMIAKTAKILGISSIAEFAETPEIIDELRRLGVDYAQGYAIGAPLPFPGSGFGVRQSQYNVA